MTHLDRASTSRAGQFAVALLVLAAYLALEWMSFIHEYKSLPVTPWNPALGVVFGLMIVGGSVAGLVLFAGVVAAEILVLDTDLAWSLVLGLAAVNAASFTAAAALARRLFAIDAALKHLRDVLVLLAAGLVGALTSGALMTGLLLFAGTLDAFDIWNASLPLMIGDVIGIAVVTPLMLRWLVQRRSGMAILTVGAAVECAIVLAAIGAALVVVLGYPGGHKLFYLLFLPVVAAALRHGLDGACLSLAATQLGLVGLLHLHGHDAQIFTEFQTQMLVLTATGLIVGVAITERRNADRRARESEARLRERESEAAQAARFNLVSGMASALAHEITQPMTAARALARSAQHILRTPGGDLGRADGNLTTMIAQIDHAGAVLRHVRDFLRRGTPHLSMLAIAAVLDEALTLVRADAAAKRVTIEADIPGDLPMIHGDHVQLQQVLLNLVRNAVDAIAATGAPGTIRIAARPRPTPPSIEIGVSDDGPGVSPEVAERLFEPLTTSKHEGLGLGLSICASIVAAHGGRIWLEAGSSRTEFRFTLPLEPPKAA